jgi:hypothetical protein
MIRAAEDVFDLPRGLIAKDPEAAAIIATVPCPKCGTAHGIRPCPTNRVGTTARIPVVR